MGSADRLRGKLTGSRRAMLLGVGGGNDAVSTLFLRAQLARDFGFGPERLDVCAVLPDVLGYTGAQATRHPLAVEITPQARRVLFGSPLWSFPERLLAEHRSRFGIGGVFGLKMAGGPAGMADALESLLAERGCDLLVPVDVGGDFIAAPENLAVLSPMMDAWTLIALRELARRRPDLPIVFGVFGLGTDAESTPEMLAAALARLSDPHFGRFDRDAVADAADFYRSVIEANRRSNTAERTLRQIEGDGPPETSVRHRQTFHVNVTRSRLSAHRTEFDHPLDPALAGVYVLFDDVSGVANPFAVPCLHGVEWFLRVRRLGRWLSHELNGFGYDDLDALLGGRPDGPPRRLVFGTPSGRFAPEVRNRIAAELAESVRNGVHDLVLVDVDDLGSAHTDGVVRGTLPTDLVLLARPGAEAVADRLVNAAASW